MTKFMISFPSSAMVVPDDEWEAVGEAAHAVIREAKAAGVYVFGGGVNESIAPVTVDGEGVVTEGTYPSTGDLFGGYTIIEVPTAAEAPGYPRWERLRSFPRGLDRWSIRLSKTGRYR